MTKGEIAGLVILALSLVLAAVCYPKMPGLMASHWNAAGEVDGHTSRLGGLLVAPIIMAVMWLLFVAIPGLTRCSKTSPGSGVSSIGSS